MKVISIQHKGNRIFKSVTEHYKMGKMKIPLHIEIIDNDTNWWFDILTGEWVENYNVGGMVSAYFSLTYYGFKEIHSIKAAKRKIHKWNVPKGTKFLVSLPFVNYSFIIIK